MNDQESGRGAVDVNIDKRSMRETEPRAFEIALGISDAGAVMCSYNRVNGDFACENSYLLTDVLKEDFRFKGFVLSDWGGTHSTAKASEIAEVYASFPEAAGEPPKRLIGWTRIQLAPGESKQVSVPVPRDRLTVYDEASDSWKLVSGSYIIRVGGSSQELPLEQSVSF